MSCGGWGEDVVYDGRVFGSPSVMSSERLGWSYCLLHF